MAPQQAFAAFQRQRERNARVAATTRTTNWVGVCSVRPELERAANFSVKDFSPSDQSSVLAVLVDRGFLAFVLLLAFDFFAFAFGIITSDYRSLGGNNLAESRTD